MNKIDKRFDNTVYLIEANAYEQLALWQTNAIDSGWTFDKGKWPKIRWEQQNPGTHIVIGYVEEKSRWLEFWKHSEPRPVALYFFWDKLNGKTVCFWEACSEIVDHKMIQNWFNENLPNIPRTNAMNFGHVISAIGV